MNRFSLIRRVRLVLIAFVVSHFAAVAAHADQNEAARIAELEQKLQQSLTMIEKLSARVSELERNKAGGHMSVPAQRQLEEKIAAQGGAINRLEDDLIQVAANAAKKNDVGIKIHGFADVGYAHAQNAAFGKNGGFAVGNLDLYMTPQISERLRGIIELNIEQSRGIELERLQIGYALSDSATGWLGRFHTPLGYWNTAFHHGAQLQTSITRPRFLNFEDEDGVLPLHTVGMLVNGAIPFGSGRWQYDAFAGNGSRIVDNKLDPNVGQDDNRNTALGGNLRYAFDGMLAGLTVGMHGLTEKVDAYTAGIRNGGSRVNMLGGLLVYDQSNWEVIAEYYRFRNQDLSSGTGVHASWAGFAQAGYTFSEKWTPYLRIERASFDQTDRYFYAQNGGRSYQRQALGMRYNLNEQSALKLEWLHTKERQSNDSSLMGNEALLQFAVRF